MISVFGSLVSDEEINNVTNCMKSQWLGFGGLVSEFEQGYSEKFGVPNFLMVDSGSNALYLALMTMNLKPGGEVILPSFTWVSCAQAVLLAGLKPVFCDVNLDTMNVTVDTIREKVSPDTVAIMVVHYAGLPVDLDPIIDLGFPVLEDAAHATCSRYKGQPCGTIGSAGIFSYDAVKNFTVGEGGGFTTKSIDAYERAKQLRYCGVGKSGFDSISDGKGRWWEYNISEPFIKMLPTNLNAAIGLGQLKKIDQLQARRKQIWEYYSKNLAEVMDLVIPREAGDEMEHSYFTYCIRVPRRDELASFLLSQNIYTTLRYHPLHLNKLYGQEFQSLPNSELLNQTALSIPLHPRLSDTDVEMVVDSIKRFYAS